jgi:hypothetical protein
VRPLEASAYDQHSPAFARDDPFDSAVHRVDRWNSNP